LRGLFEGGSFIEGGSLRGLFIGSLRGLFTQGAVYNAEVALLW
jgi:hypothetical protein